jgi:hypothetical protein
VVIEADAGRALDSLAESTYFAGAMWESPKIAWRDYRSNPASGASNLK